MPSFTEPTARVFFALPAPAPLQHALADLAREMAHHAHGRPVPAQDLHMTLAFIGAWPISRLRVLSAAGATLGGEPMRITLDRQGAFRRAGIAWIGASTPPAGLMQLAAALSGALAAAGVTCDARPFQPHLTLARHCRGPYPAGAAGPFDWDVDTVALMQSQTRTEGVRYRRLETWPIGA